MATVTKTTSNPSENTFLDIRIHANPSIDMYSSEVRGINVATLYKEETLSSDNIVALMANLTAIKKYAANYFKDIPKSKRDDALGKFLNKFSMIYKNLENLAFLVENICGIGKKMMCPNSRSYGKIEISRTVDNNCTKSYCVDVDKQLYRLIKKTVPDLKQGIRDLSSDCRHMCINDIITEKELCEIKLKIFYSTLKKKIYHIVNKLNYIRDQVSKQNAALSTSITTINDTYCSGKDNVVKEVNNVACLCIGEPARKRVKRF
jgi:hypothetical protein